MNVLITGCSSGIGRALAEACIARGDTVVATARNLDSLNYLNSDKAICRALDVNDDDAIEQLFSSLEETLTSIDLLINNAGYAAMGPVTELDRQALLKQFETNVFAPVSVTCAALPLLRKSSRAQVVNIGSVSGILTTPFSGAYCATKAAVHALSDAMRMELKPFSIDVITVQPGAIQSSFGDNSLAGVENLLADKSMFKPLEGKIKGNDLSTISDADGTVFTAMLTNVDEELAVPWTAPQDYEYEKHDDYVADLGGTWNGRGMIAFCDASVSVGVPEGLEKESLRAGANFRDGKNLKDW